jgi:hypothetical protein
MRLRECWHRDAELAGATHGPTKHTHTHILITPHQPHNTHTRTLTPVAGAEDGHAGEFQIKLACVHTADDGWLPRRTQLASHHALPVNRAEERVPLHLPA